MRLRALGTALSVLGVVGIAAAAPASGSGGLPNGFGRADSTNTTAGPLPAGNGVATRRRRRAGCHQFCQQAGGLGGDPTLAPITISRGPVRLRAGVARIYVRCLAATRCDGALVIFPSHSSDIVAGGIPPGSFGGVDLAAPPGRALAIEISVAAPAPRPVPRPSRGHVGNPCQVEGAPGPARG